MTSKNISLRKEAYDYLRSLKRRGKSFSEIILEFKKRDQSILRFFGILKDSDWDEKKRRMKELRNSFEERL